MSCDAGAWDDAVDVLTSANCFPATHNVRALLQLHGLDNVFSANDINTRIFSILQKAQRLGEVIGFEVVEIGAADMRRRLTRVRKSDFDSHARVPQ
jgi:hypothetical protein